MSKCGCHSEFVEECGKPSQIFRQAQYDHAHAGSVMSRFVETSFLNKKKIPHGVYTERLNVGGITNNTSKQI